MIGGRASSTRWISSSLRRRPRALSRRCVPRKSETQDQAETGRSRQGRVKVDVVYAIRRFARQSGRVVVVDVAVRRVQKVEDVHADLGILRELVAAFQVHKPRGFGLYRVVFDQRSRSEITQ